MLHSITNPDMGERLVSSPIIVAFIVVTTLWLLSSLVIIGYSATLMA